MLDEQLAKRLDGSPSTQHNTRHIPPGIAACSKHIKSYKNAVVQTVKTPKQRKPKQKTQLKRKIIRTTNSGDRHRIKEKVKRSE